MSGAQRPIRTTIMAGGLGGLALLLTGVPGIQGGLRPMICLAILWCLMAGYASVLVRWSGRGLTAVVFPLLTLGLAGGLMPPAGLLLALSLAIFSWIRSGICYPCTTVQALFREILLCGGGGLVLYLWGPSSPLSWALGIWLFSLVQSLFFVLFEPGSPSAPDPPPDPFEAARRRIEVLLDG
jgi:hypothetical protein